MQKVKLPKHLDPVKSAVKRSDYQGVIKSADMQRLSEATADVVEDVTVTVRFDVDNQGLAFFEGSLQTTVTLVCQRSNELFTHPIDVAFKFTPIKEGEETDELPEAYEPVEVDDHGEIDLLQLFEDELILALPLVPMLAQKQDQEDAQPLSFGEIEPAAERPNPFAVLKELKRK